MLDLENLKNFKMNIPVIMSAKDYENSDLGRVGEWLIEELIPQGKIGLITAPSKCNKTTIAWNIALSVAEGKDCLSHKTVKQGRVLYILVEGSLQGLISAFGNSENIDIIPDIDFTFEKYQPFLEKVIEQEEYKLIIIDSLYKATACNIANAAEVTPFLKSVEKMAKKFNTTFLMLHHTSRNIHKVEQDVNNISGSMNLPRAAEFTIMLSAVAKTEEEEKAEMYMSKEEYMNLPRKRILKKIEYRDGGEGWDKLNVDIYFNEGKIDAYRFKSDGIRVKPKDRLEDLINCSIELIKEMNTFNKQSLSKRLSEVYPELSEKTIIKDYAPGIVQGLLDKKLIVKTKGYNYSYIDYNQIPF